MTFVRPPAGGIQKLTTIEQASYWLRNKWPVADPDREFAIEQIDAAVSAPDLCANRCPACESGNPPRAPRQTIWNAPGNPLVEKTKKDDQT